MERIKEEMQKVGKEKLDLVCMVKTQENMDEERISIALRELAEQGA
jgi:CRISPR/Cas system-associated endoribonuclease Cas2